MTSGRVHSVVPKLSVSPSRSPSLHAATLLLHSTTASGNEEKTTDILLSV
jgi:hypothetical protein